MIDKENTTGFSSVVNNVTGCLDDRLVAALLRKLQDPALKADAMGSMLNVLLNHGVPEALSLTKSLVALPLPSDPEAKSKAVIAARLLMSLTEDAGWSVVWPALQQDAEFAENVISGFAYLLDPTFVQKLTEEQLADLYVWMVRRYPHSKDQVLEGGYFVGTKENMSFWRDSILNALKQRGTPQACEAISRIIQALPELDWLKWHLLEAQQIARRETWIPIPPGDVIKLASYSKIVLSLHGIRTRGAWQKELTPELGDSGMIHIPLDFGFFRVIKLLFPRSRRKQVEWFRNQYTQLRDRYPGEALSVIAHSFGTYLVAVALEMYQEIKFDRIIFCGSIVPRDYAWSRVINRGQVNGVLNEVAEKDIWVKAARVIGDAGPSGAYGFNNLADGSVRERRHQRFGHSDYFYRLNYHDNWLPFLKHGEPADLDDRLI